MKSTLANVASRAGVSLATASRVLNNSAHNVTPDLRARVLAAVEELHYVPNAHAQALVRATTSTVGVIVHDVSDPYFAEIAGGIQRVATDAGRLLMICNTYRDAERELAYIDLLRSQQVEAIIFAGSGFVDRQVERKLTAHLESFSAAGGRVTFIGRHHISGDAVLPDNIGGGRDMGKALAQLGHRHVGVICGPAQLTTTDDRLNGFRAALQEAGIDLPDEYLIEGDFSRDSGARAAAALLDRGMPITAIFALNDLMAVGALAALRERGIRVPDQMSVAGFDDIAIARDVTPTLTTVRVPMAELGARAMAMALEPPTDHFRVEQLPTSVILRESTRQR
jgi:LacI family transcriptional regulator